MSDRALRAEPGRARRVVAGLTALAVIALGFAFAVAVAHGEPEGLGAPHAVEAVHDGAVAVAHDLGLDGPGLHGFRAQPASRTRATAFAILAVGVVVAAATGRRRRAGPRPPLRASRFAGPAPGRGPPASRIA